MTTASIRTLLATVAAALLWAAGAGTAAEHPLKVGFVYVSPIGDAGWTYQHELGRRALEEALGDRVETKYVENVPEGAESERVIRELAASGHELIFTTSFGYMNPTIKVARQFPDTHFEHATGYKRAPNVSTYLPRFYEGRYLTGIVAGEMTQSNTLGYVAAFPIPEVIRGINAFTIGARSVNPDIQVKVIWVNSWFDPGREREAAEALIAQGADVLTHHTDSTAPTLVAEERGVYVVAYHSDMSKYGPHAHLTASTHNWSDYYIERAKAVMNGTWESHAIWGGIKEGMVMLAPMSPAVPDDVVRLVETRKQAIVAGELHPFTGPVRDQSGKVTVPAGKTMSDEDLLVMDYYVEGIVGKLPK
ncbi:MAG: BMP family ABC transporter substrate-binding protein [Gammaproteobacteria bacterium]|nr:BMP family ABC transporter substrate-binding protein [Gammaproteobacteria bacterium]NIR88831.1 BMP family ABC transporter substrate-binding protein [Gammaproteobacteria bacterium]NIU06435.1 BMP family ABC transporter substrate-binding protein [Gammaproteobacteria bacterium]NIV53327.1 BMP family ABC transporter substrate-binding protein [Gammaproteobacteria bacterium]NIV74046.1 BMP family ABC transporter substrate-binding protein [Gammaproteobacteria bacterium]